MLHTDNGTGALAQGWNRAEQARIWRLVLWEARSQARRLGLHGAQEDLARLLQIIAGAQEGTPPARLEPNAQAHESRGLHCIVMHPSKVGMVKGAPRTRRGSLDPQTCADTIRGQGLPQTRADSRADYSLSAVLRPILQAEAEQDQEQEQAEAEAEEQADQEQEQEEQEEQEQAQAQVDWTTAEDRAGRALQVWQRYILRLPSASEQEQEQAEQEQEEQGKVRKPAILRYLRGLRPLRKAQARALARILQGGGHKPAGLLQEQARAACAPCTCHACAEQTKRARARLQVLQAYAQEQAEQEQKTADLAPLHDPAPYLDWRLRAKRLQLVARLRALQTRAQDYTPRGLQTTGENYGPPLRLADPRAVCSAARRALQ